MFDNDDGAFNPDWIDPKVALEYVTQLVCIARIFMIEDDGKGFSGTEYWKNNIFAFSAMQEDWRGESVTGFVGFGDRAFAALQQPRSGPNANPESQDYKDAERLIWEQLAGASMWKVTHANGLTHSVHLGTLLDMPENEGKDAAPGTFGELLRYASVNLRQTRHDVAMLEKHMPRTTWKKGVLEP